MTVKAGRRTCQQQSDADATRQHEHGESTKRRFPDFLFWFFSGGFHSLGRKGQSCCSVVRRRWRKDKGRKSEKR
jgi:hypothetical protein